MRHADRYSHVRIDRLTIGGARTPDETHGDVRAGIACGDDAPHDTDAALEGDPFLRDPVIRVESRGAAANADFMRTFRPRYVRAYANQNCEVWTPAPP